MCSSPLMLLPLLVLKWSHSFPGEAYLWCILSTFQETCNKWEKNFAEGSYAGSSQPDELLQTEEARGPATGAQGSVTSFPEGRPGGPCRPRLTRRDQTHLLLSNSSCLH